MISNIKYNIIKENYFIINNSKFYVDYSDNININIFGSNCKKLELVYNNEILNPDINQIVYYDNENKHIIYNKDNI